MRTYRAQVMLRAQASCVLVRRVRGQREDCRVDPCRGPFEDDHGGRCGRRRAGRALGRYGPGGVGAELLTVVGASRTVIGTTGLRRTRSWPASSSWSSPPAWSCSRSPSHAGGGGCRWPPTSPRACWSLPASPGSIRSEACSASGSESPPSSSSHRAVRYLNPHPQADADAPRDPRLPDRLVLVRAACRFGGVVDVSSSLHRGGESGAATSLYSLAKVAPEGRREQEPHRREARRRRR